MTNDLWGGTAPACCSPDRWKTVSVHSHDPDASGPSGPLWLVHRSETHPKEERHTFTSVSFLLSSCSILPQVSQRASSDVFLKPPSCPTRGNLTFSSSGDKVPACHFTSSFYKRAHLRTLTMTPSVSVPINNSPLRADISIGSMMADT